MRIKNTAGDKASCVVRRTISLFPDFLNLRIAPATCQDGSGEPLDLDGCLVVWKNQVASRFGINGRRVLKFGREGRYHSTGVARQGNDE